VGKPDNTSFDSNLPARSPTASPIWARKRTLTTLRTGHLLPIRSPEFQAHRTGSRSVQKSLRNRTVRPLCCGCQVTNPTSCILHLTKWNQKSEPAASCGPRKPYKVLNGKGLRRDENREPDVSHYPPSGLLRDWIAKPKPTPQTVVRHEGAYNAYCWRKSVEGCGLGGKARSKSQAGAGFREA
jgi:hypothetical protein